MDEYTSTVVLVKGKRYVLPQVFRFFDPHMGSPNLGHRFYDCNEMRRPRKGEWYISGAMPCVYYAACDGDTPHLIAKPTARAKLVRTWVWDGDD
jgi:hypothetical protein